jgi:hypothetical protein
MTDSFFLFRKFPPKIKKKKKNPHWETGYKLEQYFYGSIASTWGALKTRTDLYWPPKKLVPDSLVALTFKLDRGFFGGEFFVVL